MFNFDVTIQRLKTIIKYILNDVETKNGSYRVPRIKT